MERLPSRVAPYEGPVQGPVNPGAVCPRKPLAEAYRLQVFVCVFLVGYHIRDVTKQRESLFSIVLGAKAYSGY